ncbi:MAG: hypothetical protein ACRDS0_24485 [Pseudonocardiaceae bacterium]
MSADGKPGPLSYVIQGITAVAAVIAAVATLLPSFGLELSNMWQSTIQGYSVSITMPDRNAPLGKTANIEGTATLPDEWNLIVLLQTPGELKYYIVGGGAVTVRNDDHWVLPDVPFGSSDSNQRKNDLNKDYKIVAVLADEKGQGQVQAALADPKAGDAPFMTSIPHNAAKDIVRVHLTS